MDTLHLLKLTCLQSTFFECGIGRIPDIPSMSSPSLKMVSAFFQQNQQRRKKKSMTNLPDLTKWAMVNTHYMVDGHPIHNKDPKIMVIINPYEPLDD